MRFMIIRLADAQTEAGGIPNEELTKAIADYNAQLVKAGVMLQSEGLHPSSKGARVKFSEGEAKVLDGPFAEAKGLIAGFTMIDVRSKDEAIEWVKRWPVADGGGKAGIEIRQVFEPLDLGASPSTLESPLRASEAIEHPRHLGGQIAEQKARRLAPRE